LEESAIVGGGEDHNSTAHAQGISAARIHAEYTGHMPWELGMDANLEIKRRHIIRGINWVHS
jgi:hypothetical protein